MSVFERKKGKRMLAAVMCMVLCLAMPAGLLSCSKKDTENYAESHRIILDTDAGGDDGLAIALAAKAPNIKIEGVTVLAGNVALEQAARNALAVLEENGAGDIPVYCGTDSTLDGTKRECFSVYGTDGMGDADLIHPQGQVAEGDAVSFIIDTVRANPNEIEIVCVGPMTNLALAIQKAPDVMKNVRMIWSMGTTGFGTGNATPVAEFNVYKDALAYQVVLESGLPMTVIGLDVCEKPTAVFTSAMLDKLLKGSHAEQFFARSNMKFLEFNHGNGKDFVPVCDAIALYAMIYADAIEEVKDCAAVCITDGTPAYGQVIFYQKGFTYDSMPTFDNYGVKVVKTVNDAPMFERMRALLNR